MKSIILNKMVQRLAALLVLCFALLYLGRPAKAAAFTCQDDCCATESACEDDCQMNAGVVRYCVIVCQQNLDQCLAGCPQ
ncbi:MAG TPA: hypothetical protein VI636_16550 [Candidatus Angelobacter sp.]